MTPIKSFGIPIMSAMHVRLERVFDKKGNFNLSEFSLTSFDPYRKADNDNYIELFDLLFDKDSNVLSEVYQALPAFIKGKKLSAFSDAVKLYYGQMHGANTNNSYPATYIFR